MFPRIIDDDLFEKVHKKALSNHYGTKSVKSTYLFRNKLRCGYCGMPISAECAIIRNGSKINYYKCLGIKKYRNGCQKKTIRQEDLEKFLMDTIINELSKKDTMDLLVNKLMEIQNNFCSNNVLLNSLIKNKKQAETILNNIMLAIEQGIINKTTGSRMKELEQQIEDYEKQILIETTKKQVIISESEIRNYYKQALEKESLTLINYLIKEIVLYNDKIEITFNSPINKSPDNQGSYFLSITRFMKKFVQHQLEPLMIKIQINFYI